MDATLACFQSWGPRPSWRDLLKMRVSGSAIVSASTFQNPWANVVGPGALFGLRFFSSFRTPFVVIQMSGMVGD